MDFRETHNTHNHFTALWTLSGTTRVSWYQKVHFAIFWIFWCKMKITQADTPTIQMDCHPIQTNWCPHLCHPCHFTPDALPGTTLPIYPGLGQAPNMHFVYFCERAQFSWKTLNFLVLVMGVKSWIRMFPDNDCWAISDTAFCVVLLAPSEWYRNNRDLMSSKLCDFLSCRSDKRWKAGIPERSHNTWSQICTN